MATEGVNSLILRQDSSTMGMSTQDSGVRRNHQQLHGNNGIEMLNNTTMMMQ